MNVKELFAKAENGTLTYDEFKKLAEESKAKFADLSEGAYVSKSKYEDDLAQRDTRINDLNATLTTRDADLAELQKKLTEAGTDSEKLVKVSSDLTSLQSKYEEDVKNFEAKLAKQKYDFEVRSIASRENFTSTAAKNFFIQTLSDKNLAMEGDKIVGVEDFVREYKEQNADSFVVEETTSPDDKPKLPQFVSPANPTPQPEQSNVFGFNFRSVR